MFRLKKQYYGDWKSVEDIFEAFFTKYDGTTREGDEAPPDNFPRHDQIIFAVLRNHGYEEDCLVLYVEHGKVMLVEGGHCSCYGFEGQWKPDEVTWFQLWKGQYCQWEGEHYEEVDREAAVAWKTTVGNNVIIPVDVIGEDEAEGSITLSRDVRGMRPEQFFVLVPNTLITAMGPQGEME